MTLAVVLKTNVTTILSVMKLVTVKAEKAMGSRVMVVPVGMVPVGVVKIDVIRRCKGEGENGREKSSRAELDKKLAQASHNRRFDNTS